MIHNKNDKGLAIRPYEVLFPELLKAFKKHLQTDPAFAEAAGNIASQDATITGLYYATIDKNLRGTADSSGDKKSRKQILDSYLQILLRVWKKSVCVKNVGNMLSREIRNHEEFELLVDGLTSNYTWWSDTNDIKLQLLQNPDWFVIRMLEVINVTK